MDGMVINTCGEDYGVQECKVLKNGVQKHGIQKNGIQKHEFQQNGVKRDGVKVNGADHIGVKYLCLTTYSYRRPGMTDEDYHAYISNFHVPLSSDIMAKFGVVKRLVVNPLPPLRHVLPRTKPAFQSTPPPKHHIQTWMELTRGLFHSLTPTHRPTTTAFPPKTPPSSQTPSRLINS